MPGLLQSIVHLQVALMQREDDHGNVARLQLGQPLEAAQQLEGLAGMRNAEVELRHLDTLHFTRVLDQRIDTDGRAVAPLGLVLEDADDELGIAERGEGEAVAEGKVHRFALERSPSHKEAFLVMAIGLLTRKDRAELGDRECDWALSRGVRLAKQHRGEGGSCVRACEKDIQRGTGMFEPRHHNSTRSHGQGHHSTRSLGRGNALRHCHHERFLVHREVRSVLHLRGSRTSTDDRDICAAPLGDGNVHAVGKLGHELASVLLAGLGQAAVDGHRVGCNDTAGASQVVVAANVEFPQLLPHVRGRVAGGAQQRNFLHPGAKRQDPCVLQQQHRLCGQLRREFRMLLAGGNAVVQLLVAMRGLADPVRGLEQTVPQHHLELPAHHVVDLRARQKIQVPSAEIRLTIVAADAGHLLVHALRGGEGVEGPPVALHPAFESHGLFQVGQQHIRIAAGVLAVDNIVRAHDGRNTSVHCSLKGRVVHFPE
mmetsp:Transcript_156885/g.500533  ORF Transcript_156885/g.500533 Transcript_156885/m.500533 type:complete len:484 (-) Transcript_156885:941-2392(-)